MKTQYLAVVAMAIIACAVPARARALDPAEKVDVPCASDTVRMAAISRAMKDSHYWAPQTARRQMLSFAQQACSHGAKVVTFVPPDAQRSCRTPPTWSTLCVDQPATAPEAGDPSIQHPSPAHR